VADRARRRRAELRLPRRRERLRRQIQLPGRDRSEIGVDRGEVRENRAHRDCEIRRELSDRNAARQLSDLNLPAAGTAQSAVCIDRDVLVQRPGGNECLTKNAGYLRRKIDLAEIAGLEDELIDRAADRIERGIKGKALTGPG